MPLSTSASSIAAKVCMPSKFNVSGTSLRHVHGAAVMTSTTKYIEIS